jgi:hypothetical protein
MTPPRLIVPAVHQTRAEALAPPAAHMTYHGGHLLTNVEVFTVFWGSAWSTLTNVVQGLHAFFDYVLTSPLMDLLSEYSVSGQQIGYGRRVGTATITDSNPGDGKTVSDDQIRAALHGWIGSHKIAAPTADTLYFVYLPPGVTSTFGGDASCTAYCGCHSADGNLYYAVEPYLDCFGCDFTGVDVISNLTKVSSREPGEAITDADLNGWSDDNTGNEIGDVCNDFSDVPEVGGYYVQSEWSNVQGACALAPRGVLDDVYRAPDGSLRATWRDLRGRWRGEETIGGSLAGAPWAATVPGAGVLQAFYRAPDNTLRTSGASPLGPGGASRRSAGVWPGTRIPRSSRKRGRASVRAAVIDQAQDIHRAG